MPEKHQSWPYWHPFCFTVRFWNSSRRKAWKVSIKNYCQSDTDTTRIGTSCCHWWSYWESSMVSGEYHAGVCQHDRCEEPVNYHCCARGTSLDGKPFRRKSMIVSTRPLPSTTKWTSCCGAPYALHSTARNSNTWKQARASSKRYPPKVWSAIMSDLLSCLEFSGRVMSFVFHVRSWLFECRHIAWECTQPR